MENQIQNTEQENKKPSGDFVKLLIGIAVVIIVLIALKLLASAVGVF